MTDEQNDQTPPRAKGRRAEAKATRRQELIDAAVASITTYGLSGTTMARVTKMAGTSLGLANFHFESKERLIEEVMIDLGKRERSLWQRIKLDPSATAKDRLFALIDARFHPDLLKDNTVAVWFNIYGNPAIHETYRRLLEDTDDEWYMAVEEVLEEMQAATGRDWIDTEQAAMALSAFIDGLHVSNMMYKEWFELSVCRKHAINFVAALFPEQVPYEQYLS